MSSYPLKSSSFVIACIANFIELLNPYNPHIDSQRAHKQALCRLDKESAFSEADLLDSESSISQTCGEYERHESVSLVDSIL